MKARKTKVKKVRTTSEVSEVDDDFEGGEVADEKAAVAEEPAEKAAEEPAAGKEEGSGSVGEMKSGDYMIHVFVEKCKDIMVEPDSTVDPMVFVECLG